MPKIKVRVIDAYVYRILDKEIRFLLLKRAKTKLYEHLWQGVAGKIEKGETASQAAVRELKEETGLTPYKMFIADHVSSFYESYKDRINFVPVFGIEVRKRQIILSDEHCECKWVDFETAYKTLTWNGQKRGLKVVFDMLNSDDDRIHWSKILI
mgnify:FL=1|tara:strand:- start:807 stop:1268 length:462 start_codon:yes stop_codon:yes gene_type:complete